MKAPNEEIYDKSTQGTQCRKVHSVSYNSVAIFIRVAVVVSQFCEIPRNCPKMRTYA